MIETIIIIVSETMVEQQRRRRLKSMRIFRQTAANFATKKIAAA